MEILVCICSTGVDPSNLNQRQSRVLCVERRSDLVHLVQSRRVLSSIYLRVCFEFGILGIPSAVRLLLAVCSGECDD